MMKRRPVMYLIGSDKVGEAKVMSADDVISALRARVEKLERVREAAELVIDRTIDCPMYPDGPCIDRDERQALIAALAECEEVERG